MGAPFFPVFGYTQAPSCNQFRAVERWVELGVSFCQLKLCCINQQVSTRIALSEKAEAFKDCTVTEAVGIVNQKARLAVLALHVLCKTIGNMLNAATCRRIIEHVDDRAVHI